MAELNCTACEELKNEVPELIVNGFDSSMCASMKNDTGLKASSGDNDCTDLDKLNDCLIGNLESEVERYDTCDWKSFTKVFVDNLWTTLKAMICAICGIWTNIHSLWTTIRSFCITKSGNTISLTSNLGTHCSVTDSDTKYEISINGHTITLTGSDGSTDSVTVPDDNTKYDLTISGHTIKLTGTDGSTDSVTVPDDNTTYTLSKNGNTITLTPSSGTPSSVTVDDGDTTYTLSISGDTLTLTPSSGSPQSVTLPSFSPQMNTSTKDGYVKKGEDDPLKVWCTNANGIPGWRNSPTLGGHLTLMDHDGWIGETKYWGLSSALSIANDSITAANAKIKTVTLTKGTWVVAATVGYEPNGAGVRALGISFGNASHRKGTMLPACDSAHETILCKTYIHTVSDDTEDVYLDTYQTSGGSLNLMIEPETYVNCVRIE